MKIIYDGRLLAAPPSGVRDIAVGLLSGLFALAARGSVDVLVAQSVPPSSASETQIPARAFMHLGLPLAAIRSRADRIFIPRQTVPVISHVPSVPLFHDIGFIRNPEIYPNERRIEATTRLAARSRYGVAVSSFTATEMSQSGLTGTVRALPIAAIHSVEAAPDLANPYLLCVAAQQPHKNLVRLIEAWQVARTDGMRLVICGRAGKDTVRIRELLKEMRGTTSVTLVSGLDDSEYAAILSSAWGYVQPSLYEGLCIPALDLAAAGVPMVVSSYANLGAVFSDGPPAQTFDPLSVGSIAASLEALIFDNDFRRDSKLFNLAHVKMTDWEDVARQTLDAME
jgi:glycosyltransferase involved in cell wall biosynthesis